MRHFLLLLLAIVAHVDGEDEALSFLENRVQKDPDDFVAQNQLASRYLELLRSTGDNHWFEKARQAATASVKVAPADLNLAGLYAMGQVQIASHQFEAARDTAKKLRGLAPEKPFSLSLLGDALFELGDYDEAARIYQDFRKVEPNSVDTAVRFAKLAFIRGDLDTARNQFDLALKIARSLPSRVPSVEAWCLVQLGQLAFGRGNWAEADKQYKEAIVLLPDFWSALEHKAELLGAQERYPEAIESYQKLIDRVSHPDLMQALGDLYTFMGKLDDANRWHERALAAYLESANRGDIIYVHHLAGFFSDSIEIPEKALQWARKDSEMRHSIFAHDAMAWAFYRSGKFPEATAEMERALALGTKDAHLLFHAGMIAIAGGNPERGKEFLRHAGEVNPRYNAFHVHR